MGNLPSRIEYTPCHFDEKNKLRDADIEDKYRNCQYKISIPLVLNSRKRPEFDSLTIQTLHEGQLRQAIIFNGVTTAHRDENYCPDRKHTGEFIFLLAAKYKYDLLIGMEDDNAGFLHTDEIKSLNNEGLTKVPLQIYRGLEKFSNENIFIKKFLFEHYQLFHLLCRLGKGGESKKDIDLMLWLNVLPENIGFHIKEQVVDGEVLRKQLKKLFPARCLNVGLKKGFAQRHIDNDTKQKSVNLANPKPAATLLADPRIKEFKSQLKDDAEKHLAEKLHYKNRKDYQSLGVEIGLIKKSNSKEEGPGYDHNRTWDNFDDSKLKSSDGVYILSSETGSGKTTFLRQLQLTILEETELIPLFIEASSAATLDYRNKNTNNFLEGVAKLFNGYLQNKHEYDFLQKHLDNVVFLIDGLDQIVGTGYRNLINNLTDVIEDRLIITSRPFAAIGKEEDSKIKFLRLKPFSENEMEIYFDAKFKRAKELCRTCPEMIRVPMLAYMVRYLIEEGEDKNIKNRTQIYQAFVNHVLEKHYSDKLNSDPQQKLEIRESLGEISYRAIVNDPPFLQRIPLEFAVKHVNRNVRIDDFLKSGIVQSIVNRTHVNKKYLYFSHQSFQEYFAAEWIVSKSVAEERILREKWNPKWKEVIKFLVGLEGQSIITRISTEKDNPIHSQLFLSAKLISETEVHPKLRDGILLKLEGFVEDPLFTGDALRHIIYAGGIRAIIKFLNYPKDSDVRVSAMYALGEVEFIIGDGGIDRFANSLLKIVRDKSEGDRVRRPAIGVLGKLGCKREDIAKCLWEIAGDRDEDNEVRRTALEKLKDEAIENLIDAFLKSVEDRNEDDDVRRSAITFLGKLECKRDDVINCLLKIAGDRDEDNEIRRSALEFLRQLECRIENIANCLLEIIKNKDGDHRLWSLAIWALGNVKDKVKSEIIEEAIGCLLKIAKTKSENNLVRCPATRGLWELEGRIEDVANCLWEIAGDRDEDSEVLSSVIFALGKLEYRTKKSITCLLEIIKNKDGDRRIFSLAIRSLGELKDKVRDDVMEKIIDEAIEESLNRLLEIAEDENESSWFRSTAIVAFEKLECRIEDVANCLLKIAGDRDVRITAIITFRELRGKISDEVMRKFVAKLIKFHNFWAYQLLKTLYEEGKLEFLPALFIGK